MESEKLMYWTTLGVLALATITGIVTDHRGWGDRLAERSMAMASQASEVAADYAAAVKMAMGSDEKPSVISTRDLLDIQHNVQMELQPRLACVQRTIALRQAQIARVQAMKFRVRELKFAPHTLSLPEQKIVIEVPETPDTPDDASN